MSHNLLLQDPFAKEYVDLLLQPNKAAAVQFVQLNLKTQPLVDVYKGIEKAMNHVGLLWQQNQLSVAHEHVATAITQECLIYCYQAILSRYRTNSRSVHSFAVEGELHDLGITMVNHLFHYHGFDVTYLGRDLPNKDALSYMKNNQPEIIAISMSLGTHFPHLKTLLEDIRNDSMLSFSKIIIGGYCFRHNKQLLYTLQYDYYAENLDELLGILKKI